ncbi:MAG: aldose 1-epimerase family protein, partial [Chitinophagales bacterium]
MAHIENDYLKIEVKTKGAELDSIFSKKNELEYLWSGDPNFWGKKSPVLFPIVGTLKENKYFFDGKEYHLSRHGFARDREFEMENHSGNEITFLLKSDEATREVYPFDFEFRITYSLQRNALHVTYDVRNTGEHEMFFSVGGHPAFKVPLAEGTSFNDYYLEFETEEKLHSHVLSPDGVFTGETQLVPMNGNKLQLTRDLFINDA